MSGQVVDGYAGFVHWTKDLKMCENSNDHERAQPTTFGQNLHRASAGDNVGLKDMISVQSNPVGSLGELCVARHYMFPTYTFSDENFEEGKARFTVICSISNYKSSGRGMRKKDAKKEAAYLMYKKIEKMILKGFSHIVDKACKYNDETCTNRLFLGYESMTILKTFFDSKYAPKTPHLQNTKNNSNEFKLMTATDTLKTISEEEGFTYRSVVISKNCDEVEVFMQLNTIPVVVTAKSGKNESDAKESAAFVILTYLEIQQNI